MNLYLLSLLIYSLMILPVSVHVSGCGWAGARATGWNFGRRGYPCAAKPARRETRTAKRPSPGKKGYGNCFPQTRRFFVP